MCVSLEVAISTVGCGGVLSLEGVLVNWGDQSSDDHRYRVVQAVSGQREELYTLTGSLRYIHTQHSSSASGSQ